MIKGSTLWARFFLSLLITFHCIADCYAIELSTAEKEFLKARDTIVFVSQTQYPPFEFIDANQQHEGMMIDVVRWLAMEIGFKPVFIDKPFQEAQEMVLAGRAHILTSLFYSKLRKERFEFTDTLFDVPASIFVKTERTDIKDLNDLGGKTIAIQRGDYAEEFLQSRNISFTTADARNFAEATDLVRAGAADAVIGDEQIVLHHLFSNRLINEVKKMGEPLYIGKNCMAANKDHSLLITILNKGILEARKTGALDKISRKWLGEKFIPPASFWQQYGWSLAAAAGSFLFLTLGVWAWNLQLRSQVRKKTAEIARNEKVLRDNEEQFHSLFDNSMDGIILAAPDGRIFAANPAVCAMMGWSEEEMCAGGRDLLVDPADPRLPKAIEEPLRTGRFRGEIVHKRKNGEFFPVEISKTVYALNNGELRTCIIFRDISDRKRAENKLFNIMREQQIILDTANIGISLVVDRRQIWTNRKALEMFQYCREEIEGQTTRKLYPSQEAYEQLGRDAYPVLAQGKTFVTEQQLVRRDATPIWVKFNGQAIEPSDLSKGTIWLLEDITERKQTREALLESEEKYHQIFENELLAICLFDPVTLQFIDINHTCLQLYGYSREELLGGMTVADLSAERNNSLESLQFAKSEGAIFVPLRSHKKKDGAVFPVEISVESCWLKGRQIMFALIRDISQRKRAEMALRKSEERLALALKASNDALWDWDLVTDELYYSPRWWSMIGYEVNELTTDSSLWRRVIHPDDLERANRVVSEAIAKEPSYEIEIRRRHKQGHYVPILTRGVIQRDGSGKAVRISGVNTDLTAQKQAEEERRQWERQIQQIKKAESLNRMAGAIAHHFNNLLGAVMGNLELIREELPQVGNPNPNKWLKAALQATGRAAEVSSLMLTYLGQSITNVAPLDLSKICRDSLSQLNDLLDPEISLTVDLPPLESAVHGNGSQIQRMLKNLVINASEAIGNNPGSISLVLSAVVGTDIPPTHRFPLEWNPGEDCYACLAIKDTGTGIAVKDIEQLFDPFFSNKFTGRGLGLSVVLGILRSHHGGVTVESEPGLGSVFRIYLPLSSEQVPQKPAAIDDAPMETNITLLLVEDDTHLRDMTEAMLIHLGFTVLTTQDGFAAVEMFRDHQEEIRAVVCDLTMPGMDGWETLAALRSLAPTIPVVLTSGYDEAQVMQGEHPDRPQAFLQKPFKGDELRRILKAALQAPLS